MVQLYVERTIASSPQRVFDWLVDPANLTAAPLVLRRAGPRLVGSSRRRALREGSRSACGFASRSRPTTHREASPTGSFAPSRPTTTRRHIDVHPVRRRYARRLGEFLHSSGSRGGQGDGGRHLPSVPVELPRDPGWLRKGSRELVDVDPSHPVVRSMTAVYWQGGDEVIERTLYRPQYFDKIVAWGGGPAINNVIKYLGPGIQLVSFDPKSSISMIGREAFLSGETMDDVAERLALDTTVFNQEACLASCFVSSKASAHRSRRSAPSLPTGSVWTATTHRLWRNHFRRMCVKRSRPCPPWAISKPSATSTAGGW